MSTFAVIELFNKFCFFQNDMEKNFAQLREHSNASCRINHDVICFLGYVFFGGGWGDTSSLACPDLFKV